MILLRVSSYNFFIVQFLIVQVVDGLRGSSNYFRVYENHTQIRFELEQVMRETFFKYSKKVLAIDENYTYWLIDYLRRDNRSKNFLVTGYFNQNGANFQLLINHETIC